MNDVVVDIQQLSKRYRIGTFVTYGRLTETVSDLIRRPFGRNSDAGPEWIWALKDVTLRVRQGEILGIVGRNGAGKTTLLKILSRITEPTEGAVVIRGRVGSLLEVGTGFHPELTGRENIFLNGAILGMRRAEISRKFDPIVDFAEIGEFLDTPVKRYSSGMYVRLAFAVAAHLEPDVLIVDEVLAVGDAAFQAKCLGRMNEVAQEGRTVLFVSHNMGAISKLCTRACWIDGGRVVHDGAPGEVVARYLSAGVSAEAAWTADVNRASATQVSLVGARVHDASGQQAAAVPFDQPFGVEVTYRVSETIRDAAILLRVIDLSGNIVFTSWDTDSRFDGPIVRDRGTYLSSCVIPRTLLKPGRYWLSVGAHVPNGRSLDYRENVLAFDVIPVAESLNSDRQGIVSPVLDWKIEKLS
jgi:lipopolysaccharide transport system ATP-binding protein